MSHRLKVAREELRLALKPMVRAFKPSEVGSIVLSFADGKLLVDAGNVGANITAEGEWSCPVTVSYRGPFMRAMKHLPKVPFFYIVAQQNEISIGGKMIQCKRFEESAFVEDDEKAAPAKLNATAVIPNFGPYPKLIDEAEIDSDALALWPPWVANLVPVGSKWERLHWPDGSITIRLVTDRSLVLAAQTFSKE